MWLGDFHFFVLLLHTLILVHGSHLVLLAGLIFFLQRFTTWYGIIYPGVSFGNREVLFVNDTHNLDHDATKHTGNDMEKLRKTRAGPGTLLTDSLEL